MLDLETLGVSPTAQIIQLGAVSDAGDKFLYSIRADTNTDRFTTDVSTLMWWKENEARAQIFDRIVRDGTPIEQAIGNFVDWIELLRPTELWCNGASFDFAILHHAFRQLGVNMPWSYRQEMCFRTFCSMFHKEAVNAARTACTNLNPHDALADAEHQLAVMQYLQRKPHMLLLNAKREV